MTDRELRLRERIDKLTDQRDEARDRARRHQRRAAEQHHRAELWKKRALQRKERTT